MSDKLKPCPFCGEPAAGGEWPYIPQSDNKQHGMVAVAQCPNRDCPVQPDITLFTEGLTPEDTGTWADVKTQWNTRPIEDELLEKFQQLQAKWDAIPWDEIYIVCKDAEALAGYSMFGTQKIINWIEREAPPPDQDALAAELEQIRRAVANIFPNAPKEPHA